MARLIAGLLALHAVSAGLLPVFTTAQLDQAVDSVGTGEDGAKIFLANRWTMTLPLEMEVSYADGSTERIRLPVEMWNQGPRFAYRGARRQGGSTRGGRSSRGAARHRPDQQHSGRLANSQ